MGDKSKMSFNVRNRFRHQSCNVQTTIRRAKSKVAKNKNQIKIKPRIAFRINNRLGNKWHHTLNKYFARFVNVSSP